MAVAQALNRHEVAMRSDIILYMTLCSSLDAAFAAKVKIMTLLLRHVATRFLTPALLYTSIYIYIYISPPQAGNPSASNALSVSFGVIQLPSSGFFASSRSATSRPKTTLPQALRCVSSSGLRLYACAAVSPIAST